MKSDEGKKLSMVYDDEAWNVERRMLKGLEFNLCLCSLLSFAFSPNLFTFLSLPSLKQNKTTAKKKENISTNYNNFDILLFYSRAHSGDTNASTKSVVCVDTP